MLIRSSMTHLCGCTRSFTPLTPLHSLRPIPLNLSRQIHNLPKSPFGPLSPISQKSLSSRILSHRSLRPWRTFLITVSLRRGMSSSAQMLMRQNYFPQSYRGGGRKLGWFTRLRYRIDGLPPMFIIYAIIGLNIAVFLLWQYAIGSHQRFRDSSLLKFMTQNFTLSVANISNGRLWTLITSAFSHSSGNHILVNLLSLYFVAPAALSILTPSAFLGLYLGGGIASSVTSLLWNSYKGRRGYSSEGASGAIYTTLGFYGALFPQSTVLLFFVVPMPVWLLIGGIFTWDLFSAVSRPNSGIDSAGHIGGLTAGLMAAGRMRRGGLGGIFGRRRW